MRRNKGQKRKSKAVIDEEEDIEIVFKVPQAKKLKKDKTDPKDLPPLEPRRSPNGYILPDPLPSGMVLTDLKKQKWKLGKSIGLGGFGEIYSAALLNGKESPVVIFHESKSAEILTRTRK